jgi:hypothetical protein
MPAGTRRALYRRAADLNVRAEDRSPLPAELERQLRRELDPEVAALESLLGRSLAAWRAA